MPGLCSANTSHLVMSASRRANSDWIGFNITAPLAGAPANQLAMVRSRAHRPHSLFAHLRRLRDTFTNNELARAIAGNGVARHSHRCRRPWLNGTEGEPNRALPRFWARGNAIPASVAPLRHGDRTRRLAAAHSECTCAAASRPPRSYGVPTRRNVRTVSAAGEAIPSGCPPHR